MTQRIVVPFNWQAAYGRAIERATGRVDDIAALARSLLTSAVERKYPGYDFTWEVKGTDEEHITLVFEDEQQAMLFKLAHGGAA